MVVRASGATALVVAAGTLTIPRLGMRVIGLEADGRGFGLIARLFASRDAAIGLTLLKVAADDRPDPRWAEMLALSQIGDIAVALWLQSRGELSRRAVATIVLSASPTLLAALVVQRTWRHPASTAPLE